MIDSRTANISWNNTKTFWNAHNLDDPTLYQEKKEADQAMGKEIAMFNLRTRKTYVHVPNLEQRIGKFGLEPVEKHEVGHYKFCPYDIKTCLILINEADKVLNNLNKSKYLQNIFADMLLNTHMVNKKDRQIVNVYKKIGDPNTKDSFWAVYMRTYERLWKLPNKTLINSVNSQQEKDATELASLIQKNMYSPKDWPSAIKRCAEILEKYLKDDQNKDYCYGVGKGLIDKHSPKDFIPYQFKDGDASAENQFRKDIKGLSRNMSYEQFKKIMAGTGTCNLVTAIKLYYLDLASRFEVAPPLIKKYSATEMPASPTDWAPEDDTEKLDVEFSIEQGGRIIPGESTYKWRKEYGESGELAESCLDLLIVLDSSGSMPEPEAVLSIPVLSSLVMAHSALNRNSKVSVINFASECSSIPYTSKKEEVDKEIMKYFGSGTVIPGSEILSRVKSNPAKQHIFIISDAEIYNLNSEINNLEMAIQIARGGGSIFLYGNYGSGEAQLKSAGYNVQNVTTMNDLFNLTRKLSHELYGDKNG